MSRAGEFFNSLVMSDAAYCGLCHAESQGSFFTTSISVNSSHAFWASGGTVHMLPFTHWPLTLHYWSYTDLYCPVSHHILLLVTHWPLLSCVTCHIDWLLQTVTGEGGRGFQATAVPLLLTLQTCPGHMNSCSFEIRRSMMEWTQSFHTNLSKLSALFTFYNSHRLLSIWTSSPEWPGDFGSYQSLPSYTLDFCCTDSVLSVMLLTPTCWLTWRTYLDQWLQVSYRRRSITRTSSLPPLTRVWGDHGELYLSVCLSVLQSIAENMMQLKNLPVDMCWILGNLLAVKY